MIEGELNEMRNQLMRYLLQILSEGVFGKLRPMVVVARFAAVVDAEILRCCWTEDPIHQSYQVVASADEAAAPGDAAGVFSPLQSSFFQLPVLPGAAFAPACAAAYFDSVLAVFFQPPTFSFLLQWPPSAAFATLAAADDPSAFVPILDAAAPISADRLLEQMLHGQYPSASKATCQKVTNQIHIYWSPSSSSQTVAAAAAAFAAA